MFGLILSAPANAVHLRQDAAALLDALEIPLSGFAEESSPLFADAMDLDAFLHASIRAVLTPGTPVPAALVLRYLSGPARPGNVLRKYVFLQLSLLPYLRVHKSCTSLQGCHLLGSDLLVMHFGPENSLDAQLPEGTWCELYTGQTHSGCFRQLRSLGEPPVLVRAGTLLPIGVNDRRTDACDADRLTLHWYEPGAAAACTLADGTVYTAAQQSGAFTAHADTPHAWHLILHQNGLETMVR